ncbi:hypothetical protein [Labrys sp. 22185]|uniref:hypothetical protein n=1 Tax=Labrys sp. 22185 TaxID=3453888 RepID=UPI003F87E2C0
MTPRTASERLSGGILGESCGAARLSLLPLPLSIGRCQISMQDDDAQHSKFEVDLVEQFELVGRKMVSASIKDVISRNRCDSIELIATGESK